MGPTQRLVLRNLTVFSLHMWFYLDRPYFFWNSQTQTWPAIMPWHNTSPELFGFERTVFPPSPFYIPVSIIWSRKNPISWKMRKRKKHATGEGTQLCTRKGKQSEPNMASSQKNHRMSPLLSCKIWHHAKDFNTDRFPSSLLSILYSVDITIASALEILSTGKHVAHMYLFSCIVLLCNCWQRLLIVFQLKPFTSTWKRELAHPKLIHVIWKEKSCLQVSGTR